MPRLPLTLLSFLLLLLAPSAHATCQSAVEAETAAALARDGIIAPGLSLTGVGRSAAAQGGEWLVVTWRPCAEGPVATEVTLYHRPGQEGVSRRVATTRLPDDYAYVSPPEDAVVEGPDGPLVLVEVATGGNCMNCEQMLPLTIVGDRLVIVEPPDPRIALREVTATSPDLIITGFTAAFESYGPLCHACSPSTTLHLRLVKDRLVEACDRFRDDYANDALAAWDELAAMAEEAQGADADDRAIAAADLFAGSIARLLDRLNAGERVAALLPDFQAGSSAAASLAVPPLSVEIAAAASALAAGVMAADRDGRLSRACPALGLDRPAGF